MNTVGGFSLVGIFFKKKKNRGERNTQAIHSPILENIPYSRASQPQHHEQFEPNTSLFWEAVLYSGCTASLASSH